MQPYISLDTLPGTEKSINKLSTGHLPVDNSSASQTPKSYQTEVVIFTPLPRSLIWSRWDLPSFAISSNSNTPIHFLIAQTRNLSVMLFLVPPPLIARCYLLSLSFPPLHP